MLDVNRSSLLPPVESIVEQISSASDKRSELPTILPVELCSTSPRSKFLTGHENIILQRKDGEGTSSTWNAYGLIPSISSNETRKYIDQETKLSYQHQGCFLSSFSVWYVSSYACALLEIVISCDYMSSF